MSLNQYHKKRDFSKTAEPAGKISEHNPHLFIIQKHAASHLHYDFRIELHGVLKSWAIPKGPSLDPHVKRLAMHVEDHPLAYGSFEGIIPKGQYGGGTVMLWDKGRWEPLDENPYQAYQNGHLRFVLYAEKLNGRWDLIRFKDAKRWFLIKHRDEYARDQQDYDVTADLDKSVLSHQTMDEITQNYEHIWSKQGSKKEKINPDKPISKKPEMPFVLSHPDKVLYPEDKITKEDLFLYYDTVSDYILPFISLRPLTLVRCPSDYKQCFYQRHYNKMTQKALHPIDVANDTEMEQFIYLNDKNGLLSLLQMGVLEIHPWGSTITHLEQPDILVFDLDPATDVPWSKVVSAALEVRDQLAQYHLKSFVKSTGGKGLHVVVPIKAEYDWDDIKEFTHTFVQFLEKLKPQEYISTMSKSKRSGKIFVDYLRNQRTATAIAAYSTRARIHAPVSSPLAWEELSTRIEDNTYTIKTLPQRLRKLKKDPWCDFWNIKQSLRLDKLQ